MIIKILQQQSTVAPQSIYSFKESNIEVTIGRNPLHEPSILLDQRSVSRKHLVIKHKDGKIYVKDLGSKNGTTLNNRPLEPNKYEQIKEGDQIRAADFSGRIEVQLRESSVKNKQGNNSSSENESDENERSREKVRIFTGKKKEQEEEGQPIPKVNISDSTLKMLKQMMEEGKSKQELIKFLKLMGYKNTQDDWPIIQKMIKNKKKPLNSSKKQRQQLEKQFLSSRSNAQKKGLGKY